MLHLSQPTISRDIEYIQKEIKKNTENYGEHLFETYRNTLLGLDETTKKLWMIVDAPKTNARENKGNYFDQRILQRLELIRSEPGLLHQENIWTKQGSFQ